MNRACKPLWQYLKNYIVQFTSTQLIATIVALPILVSWGLGISMMTFVGNLIFAPLLSLFLFTSSLMFFTELVGIPNMFLASLLEWLAAAWHTMLELGSNDWIIHFSKPHQGALLFIPIITFLVIRKKLKTKAPILILSLVLALSLGGLRLYQTATRLNALTVQVNEKLEIRRDNKGAITLIDRGFLNSRQSIQKYLAFDLQQQLVTHFGRNTVDYIELLKPGGSSFEAATELCKKGTVREIFLPFFEPFTSKRSWATFFELKRVAEQHGTKITRPTKQPKPLKKKVVQK